MNRICEKCKQEAETSFYEVKYGYRLYSYDDVWAGSIVKKTVFKVIGKTGAYICIKCSKKRYRKMFLTPTFLFIILAILALFIFPDDPTRLAGYCNYHIGKWTLNVPSDTIRILFSLWGIIEFTLIILFIRGLYLLTQHLFFEDNVVLERLAWKLRVKELQKESSQILIGWDSKAFKKLKIE